MMDLDTIQRAMFEAVRQPLTASEGMRRRTRDGRSLDQIANEVIKPNDRLSSFERLEIYNRQYWFRILSALGEDFPGLRAIVGNRRFQKLAIAYLFDCPSQSFTLRNLGSRLEQWLLSHREHIRNVEDLALDTVRLEWAEIETFDEAAQPRLTAVEVSNLGDDPEFVLQPHIRLLELRYPVDDFVIAVRRREEEVDIVSNAVTEHATRSRLKRPALPKPQRIFLAVHRADNSVYFKRLDKEGFAVLCALRDGQTLSQAVDAVDWSGRSMKEASEQVHAWFAYWAAQGWFCRNT
jgi:hypothetical protein